MFAFGEERAYGRDLKSGLASRFTAMSYFLATCLPMALVSATTLADIPTRASNSGSIVETRHNMTQSYLGGDAGWMSLSRNNYGEVCVYCHTPHGANTTNAKMPLWNRTVKATTYTTYGDFNTSTLTQPVGQPGASSLICLTCHDGTIAIDSIVNMPGSGRYSSAQLTDQNDSFLNTWPGGPGSSFWGGHGTLDNSAGAMNQYGACMSCHSAGGDQFDPNSIPEFDIFFISTDLRDDHPVGITYPDERVGIDFNAFDIEIANKVRYYDENNDSRLSAGDIRFYRSGGDYNVECASCHDPHGVDDPATGNTEHFASFLRKSNSASSLCQTCHNM